MVSTIHHGSFQEDFIGSLDGCYFHYGYHQKQSETTVQPCSWFYEKNGQAVCTIGNQR
jgi:hypothetical protein